jgi:hypothetical protein
LAAWRAWLGEIFCQSFRRLSRSTALGSTSGRCK